MFRAAAQQGGHDDEIAEAMVRPEKELRIGDHVISKAGELLTLTNEEAARVYEGRDRPLLSSGTVRDLDELLRAAGLENADVRRLEVTSAERLARFIAALAPLLLIAGALGLFIEFRTPGFGLPGILGLVCLAAFFWGHHIAGLAGWEELLLFAIGLGLLLVEAFLIPGFGVIGFLGLVLMGGGLLLSMVHHPPAGPWWPSFDSLAPALRNLTLSIVGVAIGGAALGRVLPRTALTRRLALAAATSRAKGYTAAPDRPDLVGREAETVTALRPAGVARLDGRRLDVVAEGEFVEAGRRVRVTRVEGSRVFVASEPSPAKEPA
jgi:membrane-bound serine protease (ClpP class)